VTSPKGGFPEPLSPDTPPGRYRRRKVPESTHKQNIKLYGQLLSNFANASDTDEAILTLIEGIQKVFNFSQLFLKQSRIYLPSLQKFKSSITKPEKTLLKTIIAEENIKSYLNKHFEHFNPQKLVGYNYEQHTLTFQSYYTYGGFDQNGEPFGDVEFSKPYSIHIDEIEFENWVKEKDRIYNETLKLFKIGKIKNKFRKKISKAKYAYSGRSRTPIPIDREHYSD